MVLFTENPNLIEAFYTSEQELSIFSVCVITNGTIYQYAASESWTQEAVTSEQSNASTER